MKNLDAVTALQSFIPRSYQRGQWFPAKLNGRDVEVRHSSRAGYIHIRAAATFTVKLDNIVMLHGYNYYTANIITGEIKPTKWVA